MMSAYIFVAAAAVAVLPILVIFKINLAKVKEDPTKLPKAQTNLMIGVGITEVIPIILFIYGLTNLTTVGGIEDLIIPGFIIILLVAYAIFFIFLQMKVDVEEETREAVNTYGKVGLPLVSAVPVMSIVGLFMMLP